jgi:hypothetical protein
MTVRDYVVRVSVGPGGAYIVYLPPVADAKGRFYSIIARTVGMMGAVWITHRGDSECWQGSLSLNSKCDGVLMYSDGLLWTVISEHGNIPQLSTEAPTTAEQTTVPPTTGVPRGASTVPPTTGIQ